jgi:hypothetical protein
MVDSCYKNSTDTNSVTDLSTKNYPFSKIKVIVSSPKCLYEGKGKGNAVSAVTGLEWPRGFQEVKVPRFHDNGTGWW